MSSSFDASFSHSSSESIFQKNTYIIDSKSVTEAARLISEDRLITRHMGDLFPSTVDPQKIHTVLDIGCGPGGWILDVAAAYPSLHAIGIDISSQMIQLAKLYAQAENATSVEFLEMDALQPFAFDSSTFDVINARFLYTFVDREQWPLLLQECHRLLKPGGTLRLTELEGGFSNSDALEHLSLIYSKSLYRANHSFSSSGRGTSIPAMLRAFLRNSGFQSLEHQVYGLDCSYGTEASQGWLEELLLLFHSVLPFLVKAGVATQQEMDALFEQATRDVQSKNFCSMTYLLSAWGVKTE